MRGEKYIVASSENPLQVAVRNVLDPGGYVYLSNCDKIPLLVRQIKTLMPDFVIIDSCFNLMEIKQTVDFIEEDMLCACILLGELGDSRVADLVEKSRTVLVCPRASNRELLLHSVEMVLVNFKRISTLSKKLSEINANFETRKIVEMAKGILMGRNMISEEEAYKIIRKKSMDTRMSIRSVADAVIDGKFK